MAKRKGEGSSRHDSATFEILVVLAIVAIVALTGQVLIHYNSAASDDAGNAVSGNMLSGYAVAGEERASGFNDVSIERIEVSPESPLIGDPFEVKVTFKNKGTLDVSTPFVVQLHFEPKAQDDDLALEPLILSTMMSEILRVGDEASVSVLVTTIMPEGPLRIVAVADPTGKVVDENPANNVLSKTLIVAVE